MKRLDSKQARREPFIPLMRELVRAYQAFASFDARLLRARGYTPSQADVIFTLGNTQGMTFKELGERTLITKGTLTGVIDRLAARGLVRRAPAGHDRRSTLAVLTSRGEGVFEALYPDHISRLADRFDRLDAAEQRRALAALRRLRETFDP